LCLDSATLRQLLAHRKKSGAVAPDLKVSRLCNKTATESNLFRNSGSFGRSLVTAAGADRELLVSSRPCRIDRPGEFECSIRTPGAAVDLPVATTGPGV